METLSLLLNVCLSCDHVPLGPQLLCVAAKFLGFPSFLMHNDLAGWLGLPASHPFPFLFLLVSTTQGLLSHTAALPLVVWLRIFPPNEHKQRRWMCGGKGKEEVAVLV